MSQPSRRRHSSDDDMSDVEDGSVGESERFLHGGWSKNPTVYPPGSFHMPNIIDAPRRKGVVGPMVTADMIPSLVPRERTRTAPDRLVMMPVKGGESKRQKRSDGSAASVRIHEEDEIEEEETSAPTAKANTSKSGMGGATASKPKPKPRVHGPDSPVIWSKPPTGKPLNGYKYKSVPQIGDSPSHSSTSSSSSPEAMLPRKRSNPNGHHTNGASATNGHGQAREAAGAAAKRLALERLDLSRARSSGGDPTRTTRLAAAASMVVEADFFRLDHDDDENGLFPSVQRSAFQPTGSSPTKNRLGQTPSPFLQTPTPISYQLDDGFLSDDCNADFLSPPPTLTALPAAPDSFIGIPRLNESALRRLQLSNTSKATYISYHWVKKRCMKYLHLRDDEQQRAHDEFVARSSNKEMISKIEQCGTLANGKLYVAVSRRSDHVQFWLDDHSKEEANRSGPSARRERERAADSDEEDRKPIPMLGLFAGQDLPEGTWVTQYGGVLQWGGHGDQSVKNRAKECNTHVRRIQNTDQVWDGRPWSLLFPRIPSFLEREMQKSLPQRTKLAPTVTNRTLINLLLLLHHEDQTHTIQHSHVPHDGQKNSQLPFTLEDMRSPSVCQGTCMICRNEMNVILNGLGGRQKVGDLTHDDVLATFLPQCACCSVTVGLLPCEIHEIFSKWTCPDQEALWVLCEKFQDEIMKGGLGYMSNTDMKVKQNVKVFSRSPYIAQVSDMYPLIHIYQTSKLIRAGEEVFVAYNNNESRGM